jgi:hypothetical protein
MERRFENEVGVLSCLPRISTKRAFHNSRSNFTKVAMLLAPIGLISFFN